MRSGKRRTLNALNLPKYARFRKTLIVRANKTLRERWKKYRAENGIQGNPQAIGNNRRRRPRLHRALHLLKPRFKLPMRTPPHPNQEDGVEAAIEGGYREAQVEAEAEGAPGQKKLKPYRLLPLVKTRFLPTPLLSHRALKLNHPRKRHDPDYSPFPYYFTCHSLYNALLSTPP